MKKIGLLFLIMLSFLELATSQEDRQAIMEKIEARKVAFITNKLEFSPEEAQAFWPVYNAYQTEVRSLRQNRRDRMDTGSASDTEYKQMLDEMILREEKELDIKKSYALKMSEIIGPRKTFMFFNLEQKFKEEMLRELRRRRQNGRGN